jgi:hypothetical protein
MAKGDADRAAIIVRFAWASVVVCVVAWPVTAVTIWRTQPQGVMALSWIAILYTAVQTLLTAYVKQDVDDSSD